MIDPGIKGRVAIVTGANQGIGAAAARALADQGVAVFLTYLRLGPDDPGVQATGLASYAIARAQAGESVAEAIKGAGGRAAAWAADLAGPIGCSGAVRSRRGRAGAGRDPDQQRRCLVGRHVPAPSHRWLRTPADAGDRRDPRALLPCEQPGRGAAHRRVRTPPHRAWCGLGAHHQSHDRGLRWLSAGGVLWCQQERAGELHRGRRLGAWPLRHHSRGPAWAWITAQ